jgi:hypothetical protein
MGSFPGVKWPGREIDHHLYLLPKSRMREAIPPLFHMASWRDSQFKKKSTGTTLLSYLPLISEYFANFRYIAILTF